MMLHGDGASNIYYEDCFKKIKQFDNLYDRVLMNPPFSLSIKELEFVKEALKHMSEGGVLATILPKSCLNGRADAALLGEVMQQSNLRCVVSLPNDLFFPNAGVATCVAIFEKTGVPHNTETLLINLQEDGFISRNNTRTSTGKWNEICKKIIDAKNGKYDRFTAIKVRVTERDEILFEAFSSSRPLDIKEDVFRKYLRENIVAKVLSGMDLKSESIEEKPKDPEEYKLFKISDLLKMIEKGKTQAIDRTIENKFMHGYPLVIAKKDNNGIGGLVENPNKVYEDKFCIVCGGDGGGGKTYYCDFKFAATNFVMICDLKDSRDFDRYAKFYLSVVFAERLYKTISHGRQIKEIPDIKVKLPIKNGKIDTNYMSQFIRSFKESKYF